MELKPKDRKRAIRWLKSESDKVSREFEPLYKCLNWTWRSNTNPPTHVEIKETIDYLISEIENDKLVRHIGTGGITVTVTNEDDTPFASIEFKRSVKWFDGK